MFKSSKEAVCSDKLIFNHPAEGHWHLISTWTAKKWIDFHKWFLFQVRSGLCYLCHCTCEGLESVHLKGLFADCGQIHFQLWADVILLQGFADVKYFVGDALWSRSLGQSKRKRNYVLTDMLWQIYRWWCGQKKWISVLEMAVQHSRQKSLGSVSSCDNWSLLDCKIQSPLTSAGDVVLDAKVSIGASGVVAGCEDNATHGLYLADHTGDCWGGHDAILTNHKTANLQEGTCKL